MAPGVLYLSLTASLQNVTMRRRAAQRSGAWLLATCVMLVAAACEAGGRAPQPTATTPSSGPGAPAVYLSDALNLIQANAYYADRVDWPSVKAEARRRVAATTSTAGTYETLRWVLSKLGDRHSFLLTPDQARELAAGGGRGFGVLALFPERIVVDVEPGSGAARAGVRVGDRIQAVDGHPVRGDQLVTLPAPTAGGRPARVLLELRRGRGRGAQELQVTVQAAELPSVRVPTARPLSARLGLLELFGLFTGPDAGRYVDAAHAAVHRVATASTCGWVVDLRRNTGGSLPPMLAAVGPVLGDGRAVGYRSRDGATTWFGYQDGAVTIGGHPGRFLAPSRPARLPQPRPPVAVLTSRLTGSAGEGVAIAFRGRPSARSFGEPTAGVPTGNSQHRLSDGAELYLTEGIGVDRTGRSYQTHIRPDQPVASAWSTYSTPADPVLQAATTWLDARCSVRSG
jgi:carboxyl-terminal processing protease